MHIIALLFTLWLSPGADTHSSDRPSPALREEARLHFVDAMKAFESQDDVKASDLLRKSIAVLPTQPAVFNLALSERAQGHYVEAIDWMEALSRGKYGVVDTTQADAVKRWLIDMRTKVAYLHIRIEGSYRRLLIDGIEVSGESIQRNIPKDPGTDALQVVGESATYTQRISLGPGDERDVEFVTHLSPLKSSAAPSPSSPWYKSTWVWAGGATLLVGGVATVFLLSRDDGLPSEPSFGTHGR